MILWLLLLQQQIISVKPETVTVGQHFTVSVRDSTNQTVKYVLAAWDTGQQKITPGGPIQSLGKDSLNVPKTDAGVYVRSVLPKDTTGIKPKPLRPAIVLRPFDWLPWIYAAIAIALIGIGYLLWRYWKKRKERPLDAYDAAKREFEKIAKMRLLETGHTRQYVALTVDVVRRYLAGRFSAVRISQTTAEMLASLDGDAPLAKDVRALLESADEAKFSPRTASVTEGELIGSESVRIVEETERWIKAASEAKKQAA